jgi:hypothetical protein
MSHLVVMQVTAGTQAVCRPAQDGTESTVTLLKPVVAVAKNLLILPGDGPSDDLWLWEHAERVMRLGQMLALLPEVREIGDDQPDQTAVAVAALFADAGWAVQVRRGELKPWQVLSRPTNDIQRELGVGALQDHVPQLLPAETVETAIQAIRECNDRYTRLPAARALSEAQNLDEIGVMYVLRQFRQYQAEGRPLEQLVRSWRRQLEYRFWEARINDCLRWEATRHLARERLKAVEQFMSALARDREASDVHHVLQNAGIDTSVLTGESA